MPDFPLVKLPLTSFWSVRIELVYSIRVTATIFMPIMAATAQALPLHPFLLMIPAAISASCAFMLPVAPPPNAIVFASGYVTMPQMARTGLWLNLIGVMLVTALVYLLIVPVLGIDGQAFPAWAQQIFYPPTFYRHLRFGRFSSFRFSPFVFL